MRLLKSKRCLSLLIGIGVGIALLQTAAGPVKSVYPMEGTVFVETETSNIAVTPYSAGTFRVATLPSGSKEFFPASQAVVQQPNVKYRVESTPTEVVITTDSSKVVINRGIGLLSFYDSNGELLIEEAEVSNLPGNRSIALWSDRPGNLYGAGERGHSLRLNGDSLVMYNRQNYGYGKGDPRISQMNITVPYFVSDRGYGVLFDDFSRGTLELGDTLRYTSRAPWPVAYYLVSGGGNLAGATDAYTSLTGRQNLPPFWALGYITSKYGYHNQREALGVIDSLQQRGYPVDGIVLDLYWYGKETDMGRLAWDTVQWPDHKDMLSKLRDKGVNLVAITQPYINKIGAIDNYNELVGKGFTVRDADGNNHDVTIWVGESGMFDVSNPGTRQWLWDRLRPLTAEGVEGWWGDLGEPEVHPESIVHHNGLSAEDYHNVYGNEWSRIIYEGLRKDFPERRPLLLMRGGTAGLQRYSVFPWSTDVARSWAGFQPQVNIMLNSSLSGLGYMSSDIGGFAVDPDHPLDPELYVRWLQMGTFTPTLRTHAQYKPEPYHYPQYEKILHEYIDMRYRWLPYNYTLAYENATTGAPLARPLNFRQADDKVSNIEDEYLWGDNILVAPVMQQGARARKVRFPAGSRWIDWFNPKQTYTGGSIVTVRAPLDKLPLFVKAGSFVPQFLESIKNVTQYDPRFITVRYFPVDHTTQYTMFDDDRLSPTSLQDNNYQLLHFEGESKGGVTSIRLSSEGEYSNMPDVHMLTLQIEGQSRAPRSVTLSDGQVLQADKSLKSIRQNGYVFDAHAWTLSVKLAWNGNPLTLTVK